MIGSNNKSRSNHKGSKSREEEGQRDSKNSSLKEGLFKLLISINFFKNLKQSDISLLINNANIKLLRKNIKISLSYFLSNNNGEKLDFPFLLNNYCLIYKGFAYILTESNYKKLITEIFYPSYLIDLSSFDGSIFDKGILVIPRNTALILIPKEDYIKQSDRQKIKGILEEYKNFIFKKRIKQLYLDSLNYKFLDSLSRLLYFLYVYSSNFFTNSFYEEENNLKPFKINKKLISYILGNSHEVIIRNFKKLEKLNYIKNTSEGIKINLKKLEQWVKSSKVIV